MKIATWNVNSIKVRIPHLMEWVKQANPDIVLLQELKTTEDQFPKMAIEELGYNMAMVGQKSYNGVAILSKAPIEVEHTALPGNPDDEHARYVEAVVGNVRVASIYLPNGNPVGTEKFPYKLAWLDRLITHAQSLLALEEAVVLGGDFNVCPTDHDVYDPLGFADDALCRPESRARFRALCHLGYTDALRAFHPELGLYTYWDYRQADGIETKGCASTISCSLPKLRIGWLLRMWIAAHAEWTNPRTTPPSGVSYPPS